MFFRRVSLGLIVWLWLTACGAPGASSAAPTQTVKTLSAAPEKWTATALPATLPAQPVSSPTPPPVVLCSPLAVQPLEKLAEIITQPFAMPRVLAEGKYSDDAHHGVDLGYYTRNGQTFTGTPVLAALNGQIAALVNDRPPYGNAVVLETSFEQIPPALTRREAIPAGSSLYTLYAHLQNVEPLRLGQSVACGQRLAETGLTGFTGGPHLHFETRWGPAGRAFAEGMAYYRADTSQAERANYETWRMSGQFHLFDPMEMLSNEP